MSEPEKKPDEKPKDKPKEKEKEKLSDKAKWLLVSLLIILGTVAIGGALSSAIMSSVGDFALDVNRKLFNGSIIATMLGVNLGIFETAFFVDVVKILLLVGGIVLGAVCLRWIVSYMQEEPETKKHSH